MKKINFYRIGWNLSRLNSGPDRAESAHIDIHSWIIKTIALITRRAVKTALIL